MSSSTVVHLIYAQIILYFVGVTIFISMMESKQNALTYLWKLTYLRDPKAPKKRLSILHTLIDCVALFYTLPSSQYIIALLFCIIIMCNCMQFGHLKVRRAISILNEFDINLFHATFQLIPITLSLIYYDSNDIVVNILFLVVLISAFIHILAESTQFNADHDNYKKMTQIFSLCIMLDYIHFILLLLCKAYTNNYFFYKSLLQFIPFCIGITVALLYDKGYVWYNMLRTGISYTQLQKGFALFLVIWTLIPIFGEWINASWIILLYHDFFRKLRYSKSLNENLKESIVKWLAIPKNDLLLKICCVNHIILVKRCSVRSKSNKLFIYLEEHHRKNNLFYADITWNDMKHYCGADNKHQIQTIINDFNQYYNISSSFNDSYSAYHAFKINRSFGTFMHFIVKVWALAARVLMVLYAILTICEIFTSVFILIYIRYDTLTLHQALFILLYVSMLITILYKLYVVIHNERMLRYIMSQLTNSNCSQHEIQRFKDHYNFIKFEVEEIRIILNEFIGCDVAYIILLYIPDHIGSYKIDHPLSDPARDEDPFRWDNVSDSFFVDLARFMRQLPAGAKRHIWEHAVKETLPDGTKHFPAQTQNKNQIQKLMSDCIVVYTKYLDRNRVSFQTKAIKRFVEPITTFIYDRHPLIRNRFESEKHYFAQILEEYASTSRT